MGNGGKSSLPVLSVCSPTCRVSTCICYIKFVSEMGNGGKSSFLVPVVAQPALSVHVFATLNLSLKWEMEVNQRCQFLYFVAQYALSVHVFAILNLSLKLEMEVNYCCQFPHFVAQPVLSVIAWSCSLLDVFYWIGGHSWPENRINSPVSHSVCHQRPAREKHKIRIASRENVDNQTPRNTNFTH